MNKFLAFCLLFFSTGCQQQPPWYLDARKDGDGVQLCLSNQPACPQPDGVSLGDISVYRYDSTHDNQIVWDTSPESAFSNEKIDGVVRYGTPPKNWRNEITPPALVCGKAYLVNPPATFFALKCDGTVVLFDFQHLEEFFNQNAPSAAKKKPAGH